MLLLPTEGSWTVLDWYMWVWGMFIFPIVWCYGWLQRKTKKKSVQSKLWHISATQSKLEGTLGEREWTGKASHMTANRSLIFFLSLPIQELGGHIFYLFPSFLSASWYAKSGNWTSPELDNACVHIYILYWNYYTLKFIAVLTTKAHWNLSTTNTLSA